MSNTADSGMETVESIANYPDFNNTRSNYA